MFRGLWGKEHQEWERLWIRVISLQVSSNEISDKKERLQKKVLVALYRGWGAKLQDLNFFVIFWLFSLLMGIATPGGRRTLGQNVWDVLWTMV